VGRRPGWAYSEPHDVAWLSETTRGGQVNGGGPATELVDGGRLCASPSSLLRLPLPDASSPSSSAARSGTRLLQSLRRYAAALPPLLHDLSRRPTGALLVAGRHTRCPLVALVLISHARLSLRPLARACWCLFPHAKF
jgi:hypothetical protein